MDWKTSAPVEVKATAEGVATARIATFGVVDADGDLIEPGAFGEQRVPASAYGHGSWSGALPVGVAELSERGAEALAEIKFFLKTTHGRATFETIAELGDLGEWSFGFDVLASRDPTADERERGARRVLKALDVHEVSPVLRGAGVGTQTLSAKCSDCGCEVGGAGRRPSTQPSRRERERLVAKGRLELLRAQRSLEGRAPMFGDPDYVFQPDGESRKLADFTVRLAHKLLGYPRRVSPPPEVAWFARSGRREGLAGFVQKGLSVVWLALDLRGRALVSTALHEMAHVGQDAKGRPFREAECDDFADRWAGAVLRAYGATDGDSYLVRRRHDPPPWHLDHGHVVLYGGKCWRRGSTRRRWSVIR